MECGDGPVVVEAVVAADHAETHHVLLVVQYVEPLRAARRRQAGDHTHLPERAHVAVAEDDVAALEEPLVLLRLVEAAHHRPDRADGGVDGLHRRGAALVRRHRVRVVVFHALRHRVIPRNGANPRGLRLFDDLVRTHPRRRRCGGAGGACVVYGIDSV
ncbi:hypothetical protein MIMGU_mgv1a015405mg [Erythranthe guttata]|uniref:Uncharacterized protein n=1 Tax=Erythranthe guttata TaxID=4155 RepID=A0A022Q0N8_ERYGU|nr:hypothetical protein MIMGU_mgv1a015405mg [Erythranthe guttata]